MQEIDLIRIEEVVFHALNGKYPMTASQLREEVIRPLVMKYGPLPLEELPATTKSSNVEIDARNQVAALLVLEKDWVRRAPSTLNLETLHDAVYGDQQNRTTEYVRDFDGVPPIPLDQINKERTAIEAFLHGVDDQQALPASAKASYLAKLFSSIIAAHVFADGNGRTARMAVQYCLRRWGMKLVPIPKVRNAPIWKLAMREAIEGNRSKLEEYFLQLLGLETIERIEGTPLAN